MRVLVLGAGGYTGIPLCHELLRRGHHVIALDRFFFGREKMDEFSANQNLSIVVEDIRTFPSQLMVACDAVIDLAGLSNDATSEIDQNLTTMINHQGGKRVARLARHLGRRYVYSSSASVYGAGGHLALTETDELAPITAYARSKVAVEKAILETDHPGFEPVILRNATVFGLASRMRFDLAINIMTLRALTKGIVYVMGSGEQWRPFIHVQDLASVFADAVEAPAEKVSGKIFNVGAWNYRIKDIALMVRESIAGVEIHEVPDDPDKRSYNLSFAKMEATFGQRHFISPTTAIEEIRSALVTGLIDGDDPKTHTLNWYKSMLEWDRRLGSLRMDGKLLYS